MSRDFSLLGLLRLRKLQQDVASADHASANARMRDTALRRARARTDLGGMTVEPEDLGALSAIAATRAAARTMLIELDAVELLDREEQDRTREVLAATRARSIALEKLAERHEVGVRADDLRAEQHEIDEFSSVSWHRDRPTKPGSGSGSASGSASSTSKEGTA